MTMPRMTLYAIAQEKNHLKRTENLIAFLTEYNKTVDALEKIFEEQPDLRGKITTVQNLDEINILSKTALMQYAIDGDVVSMKMLLEAGANPHINSDGTALCWAVQAGKPEAVKLLLESKLSLDVNARDRAGLTSLIKAASHGDDKTLIMLIQAKANLDLKGGVFQDTALMRAISNGHTNCVKLLIEAGADLKIKNGYNETALKYSIKHGKTDCEKLIRARLGPTSYFYKAKEWLHLAPTEHHEEKSLKSRATT